MDGRTLRASLAALAMLGAQAVAGEEGRVVAVSGGPTIRCEVRGGVSRAANTARFALECTRGAEVSTTLARHAGDAREFPPAADLYRVSLGPRVAAETRLAPAARDQAGTLVATVLY